MSWMDEDSHVKKVEVPGQHKYPPLQLPLDPRVTEWRNVGRPSSSCYNCTVNLIGDIVFCFKCPLSSRRFCSEGCFKVVHQAVGTSGHHPERSAPPRKNISAKRAWLDQKYNPPSPIVQEWSKKPYTSDQKPGTSNTTAMIPKDKEPTRKIEAKQPNSGEWVMSTPTDPDWTVSKMRAAPKTIPPQLRYSGGGDGTIAVSPQKDKDPGDGDGGKVQLHSKCKAGCGPKKAYLETVREKSLDIEPVNTGTTTAVVLEKKTEPEEDNRDRSLIELGRVRFDSLYKLYLRMMFEPSVSNVAVTPIVGPVGPVGRAEKPDSSKIAVVEKQWVETVEKKMNGNRDQKAIDTVKEMIPKGKPEPEPKVIAEKQKQKEGDVDGDEKEVLEFHSQDYRNPNFKMVLIPGRATVAKPRLDDVDIRAREPEEQIKLTNLRYDVTVKQYTFVDERRTCMFLVTSAVSPQEFYAELLIQEDYKDKGWFEGMQRFYNDPYHREKYKLRTEVFKHRCYVYGSEHEAGKLWDRVRVVEVSHQRQRAKVYFCDMGAIKWVDWETLLEIKPKFATPPTLVFHCHLADVRPNYGLVTWPEFTNQVFQGMVVGKVFHTIIVNRRQMVLFQGFPETEINLAVILVSRESESSGVKTPVQAELINMGYAEGTGNFSRKDNFLLE